MIGAIIGDIVGSRFEFRNTLRTDFELFTSENTFTDDTVMTCAVARAILDASGDPARLYKAAISSMQRVGRQYPDCGYGARFIRWMFSRRPEPYGSFGNGSAMRVSPVGFAARTLEECKAMSRAVTAPSHDHPEGLKGAEATAVAVFLARQGKTKDELRAAMEAYYTLDRDCAWYRTNWDGHGAEICQISVPQALTCFFESDGFEDCIRKCVSTGGDSDTVAAIAGGVAEAFYGVPDGLRESAMIFLDEPLWEIVRSFDHWLETR